MIAKSASAATAVVTVYDVQGRQLDCRSVVNGEATLHAAKGVNLVEVLKGNKKSCQESICEITFGIWRRHCVLHMPLLLSSK